MAKKAKHPEHENLERWLVSYADFMTLLFATFTALYALAQTDAAKLKDVSEAIRQGFEEQSIISGIKSVLQGKSPPNRNPDPALVSQQGAGSGVIGKFDSMTYKPGEVKAIKKLADDLAHDLEAVNKEIQSATKSMSPEGESQGKGMEDASAPVRPVEAAVQERGIRISFDSRLLFEAGSATLKPIGWKFLDTVAVRLKKFDNKRIHVEGHTDSQPISSALFPSNWELSAARASSVVRYLIDRHQFNPSSMVAVGYGSTQPLTTNTTPEGRSRNRRVDIILYSDQFSSALNPRVQFLKEELLTKKSHNPDTPKEVLPVLPEQPVHEKYSEGPVKVIIKEKDGTEKVLIPKTKAAIPDKATSSKAELVVAEEKKPSASVKPAAKPASKEH